jgi:hypothetical protein
MCKLQLLLIVSIAIIPMNKTTPSVETTKIMNEHGKEEVNPDNAAQIKALQNDINSAKTEINYRTPRIDSLNWWNFAFIVLAFVSAGGLTITSLLLRNDGKSLATAQIKLDTAREQLTSLLVGNAQSAGNLAIERAADAELETAKLYALTAPRRLTLVQQTDIADALRKFTGRTVVVASYGLDGEGAALGMQILDVLKRAGIHPIGNLASTIVSGGFEFGIHIRGPETEQDLVVSLGNALRSIGQLDVFTNDAAVKSSSIMGGNSVMGGVSATVGSASMGPSGPTPPGTPVVILVGVKPVQLPQ